MTKTEIIEETAAFYTSTNRAYDDILRACNYITKDGKMCAVGRCLVKPIGYLGNVEDYFKEHNFDDGYFKSEYRGHSLTFWRHLQEFHDDMRNWDSNGITERGLKHKNTLLEKYAND